MAIRRYPKFGATGKYPMGSLGPHDEGELQFGVAKDEQGNVHVNFGKDVSWLSFPPAVAIEWAKALLKAAGAKKIEIEL